MSFLGPILSAIAGPLIGSLVSGMGGKAAAAPAAAGAESAAKAQADMINMLMEAYQNTFAPAQKDIMGQYSNLAGRAPMGDMYDFQLISKLLPQYMPDVLRSRAEYRVRNAADTQKQQLIRDLSKRGITGPAAQALLNRISEQEVKGLSGVGSEAMDWEAQQTLGARDQAFNTALNMLGLAGQYSQVGSGMPGTAMAGAGNLTNMMAGQAANAAAPWQNMGATIGGIDWSKVFSGAGTTPAPAPASSSYQFPSNPNMWVPPAPNPSVGFQPGTQ